MAPHTTPDPAPVSAPVRDPEAPGPQVAIIGAGPSGCYTAQFLVKASPTLQVTVFDRLPVPFGLVRYGVAADHQGTKAITRQFERLFDSPRVRFAGNIELGRDVALHDLLDSFDAVVLATGLHDDRLLPATGATLPGVIGSGALTRYLNGHPDAVDSDLACGRDLVVIGAGNVAVDVVRLLAKNLEHYDGSDVDDDAHAHVAAALESITLVARSTAAAAKFDRAMVRELGEIAGVTIQVHGIDDDGDTEDPKSMAVRELATPGADAGEADAADARLRIVLRFSTTPIEIVGVERVEGVRVADASGQHTLPAQTVVTAIGFEGETLATDDPRVRTVGWARRGPVGTIPDNRTDARAVADEVLAVVGDGAGRAGFAGLPASVRERAVDIDHWRGVDAFELASAGSGRVRRKIRTWAGLLGPRSDLEPATTSTLEPAATGSGASDNTRSKGTDR